MGGGPCRGQRVRVPHGAARVAAALADEGEADEPSTVAIADTGGSTTQMILAALDSAGVRCRILLVGMAFEEDVWYGRPSAAAICAVRAWGSRAVQGATRLGFASPWLTAQGPDGRRRRGRCVLAQIDIHTVQRRTIDAPATAVDAGHAGTREYKVWRDGPTNTRLLRGLYGATTRRG